MIKNIIFDLGNVLLYGNPVDIVDNLIVSESNKDVINSTFFSNWEKLHIGKASLVDHFNNCQFSTQIDEDTKEKLINKEEINAGDLIKDPILIRNKFDTSKKKKKMLLETILDNLEEFLSEFGDGYSFIKSEYPIKIGDRYNYIDMLLYNIYDNCYAVIEFKINEIKKEHIGQIQIYMNYIDKHIKTINQDKTIGIIITKRDNHYYIEYSSDKRILTREYILN